MLAVLQNLAAWCCYSMKPNVAIVQLLVLILVLHMCGQYGLNFLSSVI